MQPTDAEIAEYLRAKDSYYNTGTPTMSDADFDDLEQRIRAVDPNHPALSMVGHQTNAREKVPHVSPMLSTEKALSVPELTSWVASRGSPDLVATAKLDGISAELRYKDGILERAVSRGDGEVGADITAKLRFVVPNVLQDKRSVRVRGEVVLTFRQFDELNRKLPAPLANPRNGAAGLVNESGVFQDKLQHLRFRAFEFFLDNDQDNEGTYAKELEELSAMGFDTPTWSLLAARDAKTIAEEFDKLRISADAPWDGVVFRVNSKQMAQSLGRTATFWKRSVAWKFAPDVATVWIDRIEWSRGTRDISPVVVFAPISLDGAVIQRAGGKSPRQLVELGAFPGAQVELRRSGGVIPWLQPGPTAAKMSEWDRRAEVMAQVPNSCPECKAPTELSQDWAHLRCTNLNCSGALARQLEILAKALDIKQLGPANCKLLVEAGEVVSIADLALLDEYNGTALSPGVAARMKVEVKAAKERTHSPSKLLGSVGIQRVGPESASKLIEGLGGFDAVLRASPEQVAKALSLVSAELAAEIADSVAQKKEEITALVARGIKLQQAQGAGTGSLAGKYVVVTGDLEGTTRDKFKARIEQVGGRLTDAVSKNTFALVTNSSNPTTKLRKAQSLGTQILTQAQFEQAYLTQE